MNNISEIIKTIAALVIVTNFVIEHNNSFGDIVKIINHLTDRSILVASTETLDCQVEIVHNYQYDKYSRDLHNTSKKITWRFVPHYINRVRNASYLLSDMLLACDVKYCLNVVCGTSHTCRKKYNIKKYTILDLRETIINLQTIVTGGDRDMSNNRCITGHIKKDTIFEHINPTVNVLDTVHEIFRCGKIYDFGQTYRCECMQGSPWLWSDGPSSSYRIDDEPLMMKFDGHNIYMNLLEIIELDK
jgi:hypothetical protein